MPEVDLEEQTRKGKERKEAGKRDAIDLIMMECCSATISAI